MAGPDRTGTPRASFQSVPAAGGAGCNAPPAPSRPGHVAGAIDGLAPAWRSRFLTVAACGPDRFSSLRHRLTLIVAESHLDRRAATFRRADHSAGVAVRIRHVRDVCMR